MLQSLPGSTQDWKVDSKIRGQAEDARLTVYESLRGRTMSLSPGGWRLVLDRAPRGERLPACSLIAGGSQAAAAAAPGPAGGVRVGGGCGAFSAGGRAGPAASDTATFFSVTIAVKPPERRDGDHQGGWIEKITGAVKTYATKNTTEGLLVQSVASGCLTLRGAILFAEARDRMEDLRLNRKDMNNKEIRDADRAIRNSRIQGQQLMLDGATNDLKISTDNQRAIFTTAADAIQTDKKLTSAENIAATGERGANARAGMLPGEARAAMLLGTGSTDAERLTSGMTKYKELTGDKQGTQLLKLFLEENGRREKNLEKPLTLDQFRRTAAAFYAPPSAVDTSKPDRQ